MSIKLRGFGSMILTEEGRARQRELASHGGKEGHYRGTAHEWTPEEASAAGRKGGMAHRAPRRQKQEASSER